MCCLAGSMSYLQAVPGHSSVVCADDLFDLCPHSGTAGLGLGQMCPSSAAQSVSIIFPCPDLALIASSSPTFHSPPIPSCMQSIYMY